MTINPSSLESKTAELAYFYYLERQRSGLPGSEHEDWIRAEAEVRSHHAPPEVPAQTATATSSLPLTLIKGIGPRVAAELKTVGVSTCEELASWALSDFGEKLPRLTARARNGEWIEQARELSENQ